MLTLKGPISTHIRQPLTSGSEAFSEKILGNYSLFGAHIAPKELLFLLTAPPEIPAEGGSMTTLVDQQTKIDVQSLNLDVINNVVNRILLDGSESFTYQDQVYITTVLNRLGISDAAQFMTQVRQLRTENESTFHLLSLYRTELAQYLERQEAGEAVPALPLPAADGAQFRPEDPRVTLCLNILRRLDTANLYETICSFQRSWQTANRYFQRNELRTAEYLRFSGAVSLAEDKRALYQTSQVNLLHHLNQYESGTLLSPPENEEAVLTQAAAAALATVVDNALTVVLNRPQFMREQWVHMETALRQTAENSLSRFESYHMQVPPATQTLEEASDAAWNRYTAELRMFQVLHWLINPGTEIPAVRPPLLSRAGTKLLSLTHLLQQTELEEAEAQKGESGMERVEARSYEAFRQLETLRTSQTQKSVYETLQQLAAETGEAFTGLPLAHRIERETLWREGVYWNREQREKEIRQLLTAPEIQRLWPPRASAVQIAPRRETRFYSAEHLRELRRELSVLLPQQPGTVLETAEIWHPAQTAPPARTSHLPPVELTQHRAEEPASETLLETLQRIDRYDRELHTEFNILTPQQPGKRPETTEIWHLSQTTPPPPPASNLPPLELTPQQAEEQAPETLREALQRIDQHNRYMQQTIQQEVGKQELVLPPAPDLHRTMRDALRALESPESLDLFRVPEQTEESRAVPKFTKEEMVLLQQASPRDRALYEAVLLYRKDPQAAIEQGLLQVGNLGALHAELQRAMQAEPVGLEHPAEEEAPKEIEYTERVLEFFKQFPTVRKTVPVSGEVSLPAVQTIHRKTETAKELLEEIESQQTRRTVETERREEVTQRQVQETDVRQLEHKMTVQTTEDITELVNRTLSRQMRAISDQVYRQMERRLQAERSRRGRF